MSIKYKSSNYNKDIYLIQPYLVSIYWRRMIFFVIGFVFLNLSAIYGLFEDYVINNGFTMSSLSYRLRLLMILYIPIIFIKLIQRKSRKTKVVDVKAEIEFSNDVYLNGILIEDYYKKVKLITIFDDRITVLRGIRRKKMINYVILDPLIKNNFENATWEGFIDFLLEKNPKIKVDYYKPLWKRMLFIK